MRKSVLLLCLLSSSPLASQEMEFRHANSSQLLVANMAIGGLSAGLARLTGRRNSLWRDFTIGAVGGGIVFAGKRIIANQGPLASWSGREIAAVGSSMVMNASDGKGPFSKMILPVGPIRLHVETRRPLRPRAKLDLGGVAVAAYTAARSQTSIDVSGSLANGAIIFRQPYDATNGLGAEAAGVLRVDDDPWVRDARNFQYYKIGVVAHELIHASQYDYASFVWGQPAERWVAHRIPGGNRFNKYFDLGLTEVAWEISNKLIKERDRPWETEAHSLASGR